MKEGTRMLELAGLILEKNNPDLKHGKWKEVSGAVLKKYQDEVLKLIQIAYKEIGGHPNYKSASDISLAKSQAWELIDLDDDPDVDAVNVSKKRTGGKKLVGLGHNGTKPAKRAVIGHKIDLLKKSGYYVEVSGRMFEILKSAGIHIVKDEETVRAILKGKDIEWHGDGKYSRKLGAKSHIKIMMGNPKK
jgi:hypothetical protein